MRFTAVVTAHGREREPLLRRMLGILRYQTVPPDETLVFASDIPLARLREDFPDVHFFSEVDKKDWGHEKRAKGLALAGGEYVGFFNDDDLYDRTYIEKMLQPTFDVVYCSWNIPNCRFESGSSTSGNFIVRTKLAQQVGWNGREYSADGRFINDLAKATDRIVKVDEQLYWHNYVAD